jgi:CIC family chloride channel protein
MAERIPLRAATRPAPYQLAYWKALASEREEQVFLALAIVIGALAGLAVVAFIVLTERLGMRLYPANGAAWRRLLIPVAGSLGMGYLLYRYFPNARGSGVPQTKAALFARDGVITGRTLFGKFFCTATTLASGIPLGREGPSVQVGGAIASVLGRHLGLRTEKVKALVPVGAAAAIAAAFNTPLAAVVFALEELMGDLHAPILGSTVLASATAWMVLRLLLGNNPLFAVPQYQLVHPVELGIYALLGVAGGLVSAAFTKMLLGMRRLFLGLPRKTQWLQPVAGGVVVGLMGLFVPQALGVGYSYVGDALNEHMVLKLMALLLMLRLVGTVVSYASGNAGGIFGPSLFIGAMLGGTVGSLAHRFLPAQTATPGAYALVGMGTAFAGIVRTPMTSVLMIFEITRDYAVIVPVMISNLVSFAISARLEPDPIYDSLAIQDGIHLPTGASHRPPAVVVGELMRPAPQMLDAKISIGEALQRPTPKDSSAWLVGDHRGVVGVVSLAALRQAAQQGAGERLLHSGADDASFPHVHRDQALHVALERMGAAKTDMLPVVSRANMHEIEGVIFLADVLARYGISPGD